MLSPRLVFLSAALVNLGVGISFIAAPQNIYQTMTGAPAPGAEAVFYLFASAVFAFGLGYYWVSQDFAANRQIAKLAMYGKAAVFPIALVALLLGKLTPAGLAGSGIDLVYAVLFAATLRQNPA